MLSLVVFEILLLAFILSLVLLPEQIIFQLFLIPFVVIRSDTVHDKFDFLDGALRRGDLVSDFDSLLAQLGPLLVVFLQPAAAVVSVETWRLSGPAVKVAFATFTVVAMTSVSFITVISIIVAFFADDFHRLLDLTLNNDLSAAVLNVLRIDLLGLADFKLAEFEE